MGYASRGGEVCYLRLSCVLLYRWSSRKCACRITPGISWSTPPPVSTFARSCSRSRGAPARAAWSPASAAPSRPEPEIETTQQPPACWKCGRRRTWRRSAAEAEARELGALNDGTIWTHVTGNCRAMTKLHYRSDVIAKKTLAAIAITEQYGLWWVGFLHQMVSLECLCWRLYTECAKNFEALHLSRNFGVGRNAEEIKKE